MGIKRTHFMHSIGTAPRRQSHFPCSSSPLFLIHSLHQFLLSFEVIEDSKIWRCLQLRFQKTQCYPTPFIRPYLYLYSKQQKRVSKRLLRARSCVSKRGSCQVLTCPRSREGESGWLPCLISVQQLSKSFRKLPNRLSPRCHFCQVLTPRQ